MWDRFVLWALAGAMICCRLKPFYVAFQAKVCTGIYGGSVQAHPLGIWSPTLVPLQGPTMFLPGIQWRKSCGFMVERMQPLSEIFGDLTHRPTNGSWLKTTADLQDDLIMWLLGMSGPCHSGFMLAMRAECCRICGNMKFQPPQPQPLQLSRISLRALFFFQ